MKNVIAYVLLLLSLCVGASNLYAASDAASELIQQSPSGINYVTGGVGKEQRNQFKELRNEFNLQLTFSEKKSGTFLADIDVTIEDKSGNEVLNLSDVGPLFLVQLAPGNYQIKATSDNRTQTKKIYLTKKVIRDLYFYW